MNGRRNILWGGDNNALVFLIAANLVVFLFIKLMLFILHDGKGQLTQDYYNLYANMVQPGVFREFITRPWTLVTAPFSDASFRMVFSNMLWLFSFGYLMQQLGQNRHLLPVYLYGGVVAGISFLLTGSLLPQFYNGQHPGYLAGATTAVTAVAVATVTLQPNYRIFPFINKGIPIWWLLIVFLIINTLLLVLARPVLLPVHIMAAVTGFWYAHGIKNGKHYGAWMHRLYYVFTGKNGPQAPAGPQRDQLFYTDQRVSPYNKKKKITQAVVDEILDKINRRGYGSLTPEEREILKKAKDEL